MNQGEDWDRARIAHHYRTWINRQVEKEIGHNGQMSLEEFCWHVLQLEGVVPDAPFPPVQVATGDGGFVWNEESVQAVLDDTWKRVKSVRATIHLSNNADKRWRKLDKAERGRLAHIYAQARKESRLASKRGEGLTVDRSIRQVREQAARSKPLTTPYGRVIIQGLCLGCADRMSCHGARDDKTKCNDYTASGGSPAKAPQTVVRASERGEGYRRTTPPLLQIGI